MKAKDAVLKLKKEFNENINSHVFLVETNDKTSALADVKKIIIDLIANFDEITSHQIEEENYIELIILRPDGKDIKKDQILELQERLKLKPILSPYMIYIIESAETMNEIASNKLLKTIEEPQSNVIGFLITNNSDLLLPTIKSRCEKISMIYSNEKDLEEIPEEIKILVANLIKAIETKDHLLFSSIKSSEKEIKENFKIIEILLKDYYNTACNLRKNENLDMNIVKYIKDNNSFACLMKKTKYINTTMNKLTANMNKDLLLEKIFLELKEVR